MTKLITEDFRQSVSDVMMNYLWEPNSSDTRRRMTEELQHTVFMKDGKVVDRSTPELIERGQYLLMVQMADGKEITFAEYEALKNQHDEPTNESLNS